MYNGLLAIWKPAGMTSHDVVFKLRKILKMKKVGHTGTLDPEVDGVLLVCLGQATKLVEFLMDGQKVYHGQITLGFSTETEDAHGAKVAIKAVESAVETDRIDQIMNSFIGTIQQIPPYYSAVKVNGKKLYEYARQGVEVERPIRTAEIFRFDRLSEPFLDQQTSTQKWDFEVECGKGTYVRTLAVDLGAKLGYPSHMSKLTRLATGGFTKEDSITLEQVKEAIDSGDINQYIYSVEKALKNFPSQILDESMYGEVKNGKVLSDDAFGYVMEDSTVLYYDGKAVAIYYPHPSKSGLIKPQRMFN